MAVVGEPTKNATLAEKAYLFLRDKIVSLDMPPGSTIEEEEVMRVMEMSRTPVREALTRLSHENLITILPRRGTFVNDVNIGDLAQISEVRRELEGYAAGLAASRFRERDRPPLEGFLRDLESLEESPRHDRLIQTDLHIHHFVYECTGNRFLAETLSRYYYLALRIWFLVLDTVPRLPESVEEHKELLNAIANGDELGAREIAARHVTSFETSVRRVL